MRLLKPTPFWRSILVCVPQAKRRFEWATRLFFARDVKSIPISPCSDKYRFKFPNFSFGLPHSSVRRARRWSDRRTKSLFLITRLSADCRLRCRRPGAMPIAALLLSEQRLR